MLTPQFSQIHFCSVAVDLRKGYGGLEGIIRSSFQKNPLDGALFVFVNKSHNSMKALYFEDGGFCIWQKRLEKGTFKMPCNSENSPYTSMDLLHLKMLISGLEIVDFKQRKRYLLSI
jgi:transposase